MLANESIQSAHYFGVIPETREIFLVPGSWDGVDNNEVDHRLARSFITNLRLLEAQSSKKITIHQNLVGGSWDDGMAIYDAIKASRCQITVITYGVATSMGSIIPQAADIRLSMPNCCWMLHEGHTSFDGTIREFDALNRYNQRTKSIMMNIYLDRMVGAPAFANKKRSQVRSFLENKLRSRQDWYLSAEEAKEYGLIDDVCRVLRI